MGPKISIFISYAKEDIDVARKLFSEFKNREFEPWLDIKSIKPGEKWKIAISHAIEKSNYFLALISSNSISKIGYVQKELKIALDLLENHPLQSTFVILDHQVF